MTTLSLLFLRFPNEIDPDLGTSTSNGRSDKVPTLVLTLKAPKFFPGGVPNSFVISENFIVPAGVGIFFLLLMFIYIFSNIFHEYDHEKMKDTLLLILK